MRHNSGYCNMQIIWPILWASTTEQFHPPTTEQFSLTTRPLMQIHGQSTNCHVWSCCSPSRDQLRSELTGWASPECGVESPQRHGQIRLYSVIHTPRRFARRWRPPGLGPATLIPLVRFRRPVVPSAGAPPPVAAFRRGHSAAAPTSLRAPVETLPVICLPVSPPSLSTPLLCRPRHPFRPGHPRAPPTPAPWRLSAPLRALR